MEYLDSHLQGARALLTRLISVKEGIISKLILTPSHRQKLSKNLHQYILLHQVKVINARQHGSAIFSMKDLDRDRRFCSRGVLGLCIATIMGGLNLQVLTRIIV